MEASFKVTSIDHIVFNVRDLLGAKKFYIELLGMTIDHESSWQCFLKCGNQGIALFKVDDSEDVHGGSEVNHVALCLAAGDYAHVKATLENAGIEVHGRKGDPRCVYFHDPDGHQLQLLMPE
jgi:catechol-2,3-dioxygenase